MRQMMMNALCVSVPVWFVLVQGASLVAQDATARFDVASVKPNRSGSGNISANSTRAQLVATNVPLMWLVRDAYQLQEFQVLGLPGWAASDRYDVMAKADIEKPGPGVYRQMLKNLLADRFGLVAHTETREDTVFHLGRRPGGSSGTEDDADDSDRLYVREWDEAVERDQYRRSSRR